KLMPEAHPEERLVVLSHPSADRRLLVPQPGMQILLPDVHRAAHRHEDVEAIKVGDWFAAIKPHDSRREAVCSHVPEKRSGMAIRGVLEDGDARHRLASRPWVFP